MLVPSSQLPLQRDIRPATRALRLFSRLDYRRMQLVRKTVSATLRSCSDQFLRYLSARRPPPTAILSAVPFMMTA